MHQPVNFTTQQAPCPKNSLPQDVHPVATTTTTQSTTTYAPNPQPQNSATQFTVIQQPPLVFEQTRQQPLPPQQCQQFTTQINAVPQTNHIEYVPVNNPQHQHTIQQQAQTGHVMVMQAAATTQQSPMAIIHQQPQQTQHVQMVAVGQTQQVQVLPPPQQQQQQQFVTQMAAASPYPIQHQQSQQMVRMVAATQVPIVAPQQQQQHQIITTQPLHQMQTAMTTGITTEVAPMMVMTNQTTRAVGCTGGGRPMQHHHIHHVGCDCLKKAQHRGGHHTCGHQH